MRFIIVAPPYNNESGGSIVLHKLCHTINLLGHESVLRPLPVSFFLNRKNLYRAFKISAHRFFKEKSQFSVNGSFCTPFFFYKEREITNDDIVVYPEIVLGNPLKAKNVVRWILHQPGYHAKKIQFGENELHFDFGNFAKGFKWPRSMLSELKLAVTHFPLEIYNEQDAVTKKDRMGTAYCVRKGKGKPFIHDPSNAICIDGKTHSECAKIFKKVDLFISYDPYTAYSVFASLCGADSVVIPDDGVLCTQWISEERDRWGVAYGLNDIDYCCRTREKLREKIAKADEETIKNVSKFVQECMEFFT